MHEASKFLFNCRTFDLLSEDYKILNPVFDFLIDVREPNEACCINFITLCVRMFRIEYRQEPCGLVTMLGLLLVDNHGSNCYNLILYGKKSFI